MKERFINQPQVHKFNMMPTDKNDEMTKMMKPKKGGIVRAANRFLSTDKKPKDKPITSQY